MTGFAPIRRRRIRLDGRGVAATAAVLVGVLIVWQAGVVVSGTSDNVLPTPLQVVTEADWATVLTAAGYTIAATIAGFVVGNLAGLILAVAFSASRTISDTVYPLAVTVRSIPVVALAPFITLAFGREAAAAIVVSALIVFFPTLINVIMGLRSVPAEALELMHVINATTVFSYARVRLPYAAPSFFSALRIAAPNAVLGVMTAEWIIGGDGLGRLVIQAWLRLEIPTVWAAVTLSAVVAWVLFSLVAALERIVVGWAVRT